MILNAGEPGASLVRQEVISSSVGPLSPRSIFRYQKQTTRANKRKETLNIQFDKPTHLSMHSPPNNYHKPWFAPQKDLWEQ